MYSEKETITTLLAGKSTDSLNSGNLLKKVSLNFKNASKSDIAILKVISDISSLMNSSRPRSLKKPPLIFQEGNLRAFLKVKPESAKSQEGEKAAAISSPVSQKKVSRKLKFQPDMGKSLLKQRNLEGVKPLFLPLSPDETLSKKMVDGRREALFRVLSLTSQLDTHLKKKAGVRDSDLLSLKNIEAIAGMFSESAGTGRNLTSQLWFFFS